MGLWSHRAICPNCGGKIHTQRGAFSPKPRTGNHCQWCGIALTGKIDMRNKAITVEDEQEKAAAKAATKATHEAYRQRQREDLRTRKEKRQERKALVARVRQEPKEAAG